MTRSTPHLRSTLLALVAVASSVIGAPPKDDDHHISASLLSTATPAPGDDFLIALDLTVDEGWHTYWPGINDTGYGVSIDFTPIEGVTFGEPYFPTPIRHIASGNILDHIYEHTFRVIVPVKTSSVIPSGTEFTIHATTNALVCKDICIPETAAASIDLVFTGYPVHGMNPEITDAYNTRATMLVGGSVQWIKGGIRLTIPDATRYQFFPAASCTQPSDLMSQGDTESTTLTISFDRSYDEPGTPLQLAGRVRALIHDEWKEFTVNFTQTP